METVVTAGAVLGHWVCRNLLHIIDGWYRVLLSLWSTGWWGSPFTPSYRDVFSLIPALWTWQPPLCQECLSFWVNVFSGCEPSHWETRAISTKYEQCNVFRWFSKALLCLDFCGPTISSSFFMFGKANRNSSSLLVLCLFLCWLSNF